MIPRQCRKHAFQQGFRSVAPMLPGIAPFGMTTGIAALEAGLDPIMAMGMSVIIFAGASQLVAGQLIADGAMPMIIVLTALLINLRMLMYSAAMAVHLGYLPTRWKMPLAYLLTDQAFSLTITRFQHGPEPASRRWYYLGVALPVWLLWQAATALGVWLGAAVPASWQIGFALPLVFLVLLVPVLRDRPSVTAGLTGGAIALAAHDAPYHLGLTIGALAGIAAGALTERMQQARQAV